MAKQLPELSGELKRHVEAVAAGREAPRIHTAPPVVVPVRACGLDAAPKNSKIVVVSDPVQGSVPVLMTPAGQVQLAHDDIANDLPEGARIFRNGDTLFTATQLNAQVARPVLAGYTAREVILKFNQHFHDVRGE